MHPYQDEYTESSFFWSETDLFKKSSENSTSNRNILAARTVVDEDEEKFKNSDDNGAGVIEHNPVLELQFDDLLIAALEDDF